MTQKVTVTAGSWSPFRVQSLGISGIASYSHAMLVEDASWKIGFWGDAPLAPQAASRLHHAYVPLWQRSNTQSRQPCGHRCSRSRQYGLLLARRRDLASPTLSSRDTPSLLLGGRVLGYAQGKPELFRHVLEFSPP